jgi:hypothetical protein
MLFFIKFENSYFRLSSSFWTVAWYSPNLLIYNMNNFKIKQSRFAQGIIKRFGNINGTISVKRGRPVVNMLLNMANTLG